MKMIDPLRVLAKMNFTDNGMEELETARQFGENATVIKLELVIAWFGCFFNCPGLN